MLFARLLLASIFIGAISAADFGSGVTESSCENTNPDVYGRDSGCWWYNRCMKIVGGQLVDPGDGMEGTHCVRSKNCHNTDPRAHRKDDGCTSSKRTCVNEDGSEPPVGLPGARCDNRCVDHRGPNKKDYGCTSSNKRCMYGSDDARNGPDNRRGWWCSS